MKIMKRLSPLLGLLVAAGVSALYLWLTLGGDALQLLADGGAQIAGIVRGEIDPSGALFLLAVLWLAGFAFLYPYRNGLLPVGGFGLFALAFLGAGAFGLPFWAELVLGAVFGCVIALVQGVFKNALRVHEGISGLIVCVIAAVLTAVVTVLGWDAGWGSTLTEIEQTWLPRIAAVAALALSLILLIVLYVRPHRNFAFGQRFGSKGNRLFSLTLGGLLAGLAGALAAQMPEVWELPMAVVAGAGGVSGALLAAIAWMQPVLCILFGVLAAAGYCLGEWVLFALFFGIWGGISLLGYLLFESLQRRSERLALESGYRRTDLPKQTAQPGEEEEEGEIPTISSILGE